MCVSLGRDHWFRLADCVGTSGSCVLLFACAFLHGILFSGQTVPAPASTNAGSFGGFAFGAPTPAPAPFGATSATPVPPSSGFGGFGISSAAPAITSASNPFVEPPSNEAYAVGGYGRSYPGWRRMTGAVFQAQAAAVVAAHTRGQGLPVMDAQTDFTSMFGASVALYFDEHMLAHSTTAGTLLRTLKSSAGRAQLQGETSTGGPGFGGPSSTTRWLDSPPPPDQITHFAFQAAFAQPPADKPTLFVRDVRSLRCR
jgi:hypothetical protein